MLLLIIWTFWGLWFYTSEGGAAVHHASCLRHTTSTYSIMCCLNRESMITLCNVLAILFRGRGIKGERGKERERETESGC